MFETMTSAFVDEYPRLLKNRKLTFTIGMCILLFLFGIPCVTQGGVYILQIMDWYASSFSLMLLSLTECVVIAWVYGADRFYKDIELMIGYQPGPWWKICWKYITPSVIIVIWIFSVSSMEPVSYGDYQYPSWAIAMGWGLSIISIIPLPLVALHEIYKEEGPILQRIKKLARPADNWGPALEKHREEYLASLEPEQRPSYRDVTCTTPIYLPTTCKLSTDKTQKTTAFPEQVTLLGASAQDLPVTKC